MSTETLEREQQQTATNHDIGTARKHPRLALSLVEQHGLPTRATTVLPTVAECDLLVAGGLRAPIELPTQPFSREWMRVKGKRLREIERELHSQRWNFFYLIPDVKVSAIARSPEAAIHKAMNELFQRAAEQGVNTLEIATLRTQTLLGFHRVQVIVRLRHIQESPYLFTTNEEMHMRMLRVKGSVKPIQLRRRHYGRNYREYKPF